EFYILEEDEISNIPIESESLIIVQPLNNIDISSESFEDKFIEDKINISHSNVDFDVDALLNITEYLKDIQLKYGDFCEVHFGPKRIIIVSNSDVAYPIHASTVTLNNKFLYRDSENPGMHEIGMENCGIVSNRNLDEWKINREFFIRVAMSKKFLKMLTEKTYEKTTDMFKLWDIMINDKREIDLSKWTEKFSGDIAVSTSTGLSAYSIFSYFKSLGYDHNHNYIPTTEWEQSSKLLYLVGSFFKIAQWFVYIPPSIRHAPGINYFDNRFLNVIKKFEVFIVELIRRRRAKIDGLSDDALLPSDFLTLLLTINTPRDQERSLYKSLNRSLNDHEIFGVIRDIFLGSIETVTTAMCLVFYYICKYPSVKYKALSEINEKFGHSIALNSLYEDIEKLPYCEALIKEALRLNSPLPYLPRSNSEPAEVGGYLWKEGQTFILHYQRISINKDDWVDADVFDPERFLKNENSKRSINAKEANNKKAFATFGGGARICPGKLWALIEIKVLLVAVLMRYDMEFVNKDQELDLFCDSSYHWRELRIRLRPRIQEE
ncbi:8106_t:CDS:2, partial [Cetraspora pellucida]